MHGSITDFEFDANLKNWRLIYKQNLQSRSTTRKRHDVKEHAELPESDQRIK